MELKVIETQEDLLKAFIIRGIVFIEEQNCPYDEEIDKYEDEALHILGEVDGEPVACGRIRFINEKAKLERIAIRKNYRGGGAGHRLVEFMMNVSKTKGYTSFKLHGQKHLKRFYESMGFVAKGDEFIECGIPHILFVK